MSRAVYSLLLIACLWSTSSIIHPCGTTSSPTTTLNASFFVKQSSGQRDFATEKKVNKNENVVVFSNRPIAEKNIPSGFFLSSAITQHLINSTII